MEEVYVIEFEFERHQKGDYDNYTREHRVFGVFDTERRAMCYLRQFLNEKDVEYKGYLKTVENLGGYTRAEAVRWYDEECGYHTTETLYMRPMKLNALQPPCDEVLNTFC